jgi:flagella basal body P-ring formation protein FlgA
MRGERIIAGLVVLAAGLARADSISLRTFARVNPGAAVTLGDVAELSGAEAQGLAGLIICGAGDAATSVELGRVRQSLKSQAGVNMGHFELSGGTCLIRRVEAVVVATTPAAVAKPVAPAAPVEMVKDRVAARIAMALGADPSDLKLDFEDQQALLSTPTGGRTIAVQPTGTSDKISLSIRVYEGDTIVAQGVVRVGVLVRRDVVVARTALPRGTQTRPDMLEGDRQWLAPTVEPATPAQAVGAVTKSRIEAGKIVLARDVEAPLVVHKGDLISVDCIAGTVVVGTTARAKENGTDGQVIELQSLSSKKTYLAKINGAGRAVLVAGDSRESADQPAADRRGS